MVKKYYARSGKFKQEDAQVFGERLEKIGTLHKGKIKPIDVVNDAAISNSPFHDYFVWDDTVAGQKYRLQQARELISNVVEVVIIEGTPQKQRSFFNVIDSKSEKVYVTLSKAVSTKSYRNQLLDKLISTLENGTQLMKLFKNYDK